MIYPIDTITKAYVRALLDESGVVGDLEQVAICQKALLGDYDAWQKCIEVILEQSKHIL